MAAKLLKGADSCYWASPGMAWSGAQAMDGPRRGPHGAQRGAGGGHRRLDDLREGVHGAHPWASAHPPDTVQGIKSQR
jgi:hypothetical protein